MATGLENTAVDPMTGRRGQRRRAPERISPEIRGLMASAVDPLAPLRAQSADATPLYQQLIDYLAARQLMPPMNDAALRYGTRGARYLPTVNDPLGRIAIDAEQANLGTIPHELTHVADEDVYKLYYSLRNKFNLTDAEDRFVKGFEKLVFKSPGSVTESLTADRRRQLANLLDKDWAAKNAGYRSAPDELAAFGVGSTASPDKFHAPPLHLDPTMASEFSILLDLANRVRQERPPVTYTRTRE